MKCINPSGAMVMMIRLGSSAFPTAVLLTLAFCATSLRATESDGSQLDESAPENPQTQDLAIEAAQSRVTLLRQAASSDPLQLAEALTTLAAAHAARGNYAPAESAYREAVNVGEQRVGLHSIELVRPLQGLGETLGNMGRHEAALGYLERAVAIIRSHLGVFDPSQQKLLRISADNLMALGRDAEAEEKMLYTLHVAENTYGEGDPRIVPTLCEAGDWFSLVGKPREARMILQVALNIVESRLDRNHVAAVVPLRGIATSYVRELTIPEAKPRVRGPSTLSRYTSTELGREPKDPRRLNPNAERSLKRAVQLLEMDPELHQHALVDTLIQLGDLLQIKQAPDEALPLYKRAWNLQRDKPDPASSQLDKPVRLYYPVPLFVSLNLMLSAEEIERHFVEVEFNVESDGSVLDAKIVEHDTTKRYANDILDAIRSSRYRPKFVEGAPTSVTAMRYRETFTTPTKPQDSKKR
jgi:tetratricopeptide (TPR) repeat protein